MQEIITFIMEIIGTIAFAASGAMVGVGRRMDIFGVCVLGVVTSVGGGMIRDIVLGNHSSGNVSEAGLYDCGNCNLLCGVLGALSEKRASGRPFQGNL